MRMFALVSSEDYTLRAPRRNNFTRLSSAGIACRLLGLGVNVLQMKSKIGHAGLRLLAALLLIAWGDVVSARQRPKPGPAAGGARTLTILAEPNTIVWVDEIRRGTTDAGGTFSQLKISAGAHTLRARGSVPTRTASSTAT